MSDHLCPYDAAIERIRANTREQTHAAREDVMNRMRRTQIAVLSDAQLSVLAEELHGLRRQDGETDEELRARLVGYYRTMTTPGTKDGIRRAVAFYTGVPFRRVRLVTRRGDPTVVIEVLVWRASDEVLERAHHAARRFASVYSPVVVRHGVWWRCCWARLGERWGRP
jgi:hypothetical protein